MKFEETFSLWLLASGKDRVVVFEPWAEELLLSKGERYKVLCESNELVEPEIEITNDRIVLHGNPDNKIKVFFDETVIWESY